MRALIFGDDSEPTLRDQIEEAIDEAEDSRPVAGDLSPVRAADAAQPAAFRRPHRRRHLRDPRRHHRGAVDDQLRRRWSAPSPTPATAACRSIGDSLDEVIGMVHIKDVFIADVDPARDRSLTALMREPLFVPESMGVIDLLARMRAERTHLAIVVDEFGGTEGLVTIEDVVEEIVGDIEDEHDEAEAGMLTMLDDGLWEADARIELEELAKTVDARLTSAKTTRSIRSAGSSSCSPATSPRRANASSTRRAGGSKRSIPTRAGSSASGSMRPRARFRQNSRFPRFRYASLSRTSSRGRPSP